MNVGWVKWLYNGIICLSVIILIHDEKENCRGTLVSSVEGGTSRHS